jgi:hypothetical protein
VDLKAAVKPAVYLKIKKLEELQDASVLDGYQGLQSVSNGIFLQVI